MGAERRHQTRVRAAAGLTLLCTSSEEGITTKNLALRLVDISPKGACIGSAALLRTGMPVKVDLAMPQQGTRFSSRGVVRWVQTVQESGGDAHLAGLEFEQSLQLPGEKGGDPHVLEILQVLRVSVAQLRLYPKESPQVLKIVTDAYHAMHSYLEDQGALTLSKTPKGLLVNGRRMTATGTVVDTLEASMLAVLGDAGVKSITVKKGLALEELITFLHALTKKFWDAKEGKEINRRLRDERVLQVSVDEVQYVAVGEGDIVIEDAARKLQGGESELARILESLDHVIDAAAGTGLVSEGRLHIMKRFLDQDPTLLGKIGEAAKPAASPEMPASGAREAEGRIPFEQARDAVGRVAELLQMVPPELRGPLRDLGLLMASAFQHTPKLSSVLGALLTDEAVKGMTEWTEEAVGRRPQEAASMTRGREILALPDEQKVQALSQEGSKILEELAAMGQKEMVQSLLNPVMASVTDHTTRQRLAAGKALLGMRRVLEKSVSQEVLQDLDQIGRVALEQEREAGVYPVMAELASFMADLRIRKGAAGSAIETLELLNRHYHIKDPQFAQRAEQAYIALERVSQGGGFASLTEKVRAGDPEAIRVLEALDAAAVRFLIDEIKSADTSAKRLWFAQFIARAGAGAAAVLVSEIQKVTSPSDVLRLIEVLPQAMPVDMAELALGALLRHPATSVRRRSALMVAELAFPRAGEMLLEAFHEEKEAATRLAFVECLGKLKYRPSLEALVEAAEDRTVPEDLRSAACLALGRLGDVRAVAALVKLASRGGWGGLTKVLRNVAPAVRAASVRGLALYASVPEARDAIREAEEDKDAGVRFAASQARLAPLFEALGDLVQGAQRIGSSDAIAKGVGKVAGDLLEAPLQPVCLALSEVEATGLLLLNFKGPTARVWMDRGLVTAVEFETRRDLDAFRAFKDRREGHFVFVPEEHAPERRMLSPLENLFHDSRMRGDSGRLGGPSSGTPRPTG